MMALTHHYIVRLAALKVGLLHFRDYALLGDDIVIANQLVAEKYKELLKTLEMPISFAKTHESLQTYEFAKRWIHAGVEITPYAFSGIFETWKSYSLLQNFLETQQQHGWELREGRKTGHVLEEIYDIFGKPSQAKRSRKLLDSFTLLLTFIKTNDNKIKAEAANELFTLLALPVPERVDLVLFTQDMINSIIVQQGKEDHIKIIELQKEYLKVLSEKIRGTFSEARIANQIRLLLVEYHPLLGAIGSINNNITEALIMLENGTQEQINDIFKSRVLSASMINMGIFSMRTARSRILAQSRLVKEFRTQTELFFKEGGFYMDF